MLIDCHLHTNHFSPCSRMSAEELATRALEQGLDAVVFTDHHACWPRRELARLQERFPGLGIFSGVEVTLQEGYDVVVFGETIQTAPLMPFEDLLETVRPMREHCFLFVAHAFRYNPRLTPKLRSILPHVDGLEMNSVNILLSNSTSHNGRYQPLNAKAYEMARVEYNLIPLYNTDAHLQEAVGCIANQLGDVDLPEDEADLARLFKSRQPEEHQSKSCLTSILDH